MSKDIDAQISYLDNRAAQLYRQGRFKEAIGPARELCDLARRELGDASPSFINCLYNLAELYQSLRDDTAVEQTLRQALDILRRVPGENDSNFARCLDKLARVYYSVGNYNAAEPLFLQHLEIQRKVLGEEHPDYAVNLHNLALLYGLMGKPEAAQSLYLRALDIFRRAVGEEDPDFVQCLHELAQLHFSRGNYAAAEPLFKQHLEIQRKLLGEAHPDFATCLNNLAMLYLSTGNNNAAEPLLRQSLDLLRRTRGEDDPTFGRSLNNLAGLYHSMGDYTAAEPLFRQAVETLRRTAGEDHPTFAQGLNNLATLYKAIGNYAAAEPLFRQALEILRATQGEGSPQLIQGLNNLAMLYQSLGNYRTAEQLFLETIAIMRRTVGEEHPDTERVLTNLANLYGDMGKYAAAEVLLRQVLDVTRRRTGEESLQFAESVRGLAELYQSMRNYAAAEPLYLQAIAVLRRTLNQHHPKLAAVLNSLAVLYSAVGNYMAAESLHLEAIKIQLRALGDEHPNVGGSLSNLAAMYGAAGNYAAAEALFLRAQERDRRVLGEEHPDFAITLSNSAALQAAMGNYEAAEPLYRQAVAILRKSSREEHPDFAKVLNNLAALCVATNRKDEALGLMHQAGAIENRMIGEVFSVGSEMQRMIYARSTQRNFYTYLSLAAKYCSNSSEAVRAAFDLVLRRKAMGAEALAAQRDAVLGGEYPALRANLQELTTLRWQIAQTTLAGPGGEGIEIHRRRLEEWTGRKERLEANLARQIPEMNLERRLRTATRQAVALALPKGSVLVEFVRFEVFNFQAVPARGETQWNPARYLAFILKAGEPDNVHVIEVGEAETVDQMIATFRAELTNDIERRGSQDAQSLLSSSHKPSGGLGLRQIVFDPLLIHLSGRNHLLMAPDGELSRLPFEVLPASDGRYLIDEYHISYLGAGRDVLRFRSVKSGRPRDSLVVADPDFELGGDARSEVEFWSRSLPLDRAAQISAFITGRQRREFNPRTLYFKPLAAARVEGEQVAAMLGVEPWLGARALEGPLKAFNSPRILHIATHGFFQQDQKRDPNKELFFDNDTGRMSGAAAAKDNPLLRSGLVLAGFNTWSRGGSVPIEAEDGLLTAEDVSGLNLLDTELVVLSACETGLGEVRTGEGVFGLRRSFVLAGTKGLIMSLWKVPDEETRVLMVDFYGRILKDGPAQSPAEALREAKLAMKAKEKYRDPSYWGAFIFEGDPSAA